MAYSFSDIAAKRSEGSLTIHEPPMPSAGMVRSPDVCITAENFELDPASENQSGFGSVSLMVVLAFMSDTVSLQLFDYERAGQVGAKRSEKKEFALRLDSGAIGQIFAQMPFWRQVREEGGQTHRDGAGRHDKAARLSLIGEAQGWPVRIIAIALFEGKQVPAVA